MNRLFTILLFIIFLSCSSAPKSDSNYHSFDKALEDDTLEGNISVEMIKKPSIGNISIATGSLQLSVLSSCLVCFDFEDFFEEVNLPASGTIPVDNINPGYYYIQLEYSDYTIQDIGFNIFPGETTNLSLGYRSGLAPHFPPVSTIQSINITTQDGMPEWVKESPPDDCIWGIGTNKDRYTAEKDAYVTIARQLSTEVTSQYNDDINGLPVWDETLCKTKNIAGVASASKILDVSYDPKNKIFWVLAELNKSNEKK